MKKISLWAKDHVLITRIIIFFIHLLLILIAFYLSENIQIDFSFAAISVIVFILIAGRTIYPFARKKSYAFQKTVLFVTSTCCFLIICFAMKHNFSFSLNQNVYSAVSLPFDSTNKKTDKQNITSLTSYKDYKSLSKAEKKAFRKELKKEIKVYKKELKKTNRPKPTWEDALLIFLIVLCAIALLFGLSILVCGISCGGVPAAAILLTLFGMGGVGVGLYFIIRKLHRNVEKERKHMEKNQGNTMQQPVLSPVTI